MNILIGVSGGIAAYKIYELIRLFIKNGDSVKVMLTENAKNFVQPLVIETLSQNICYTNMFSSRSDMAHIELTKWADTFIIAPATANIIGKIASGIGDDLLSTTVLSWQDKPCFIFPAMNTKMYTNQIVQENIARLKERDFLISGPLKGELACGDTGAGRLPEPQIIYNLVKSFFAKGRLEFESEFKNKKILITAGHTKAYIDPVRFISNDSSGRMGVEIAASFYFRGAKVVFMCNKRILKNFPEIQIYAEEIIIIDTTEEVLEKASGIFNEIDIYISSAALSDFENSPCKDKIKKTKEGFNLAVNTSPDVFKELSKKKKHQLMVGFALETNNLVLNAKEKLKSKNMDIILANKASAINALNTDAKIIDKNGKVVEINNKPKAVIAETLVGILKEIAGV